MKIYIALIASILLFVGCSQKKTTNILPQKLPSLQTIIEVIDAEEYQRAIDEDHNVFKPFTTPNYLGASPVISKDSYFKRKNGGETLLFVNEGIENKLPHLLNADIETLNYKAKKIGYTSISDMYEKIYNHVKDDTAAELYDFLVELNKKYNINVKKIVDKKALFQENEITIKTIFKPYIQHEDSKISIPAKEWKINALDGSSISFTKKSYIPYTFIIMVMKEVLNNV